MGGRADAVLPRGAADAEQRSLRRRRRLHGFALSQNERMTSRRDSDDDSDDRPPICPNCGVTQGIVVTGGETRFVCLECGFPDSDEQPD